MTRPQTQVLFDFLKTMIFLNFLFLKNVFGQSSYDWPEQELHKRLLEDYEKDVRPVNLKGRYIQDSGF